MKRRSFLQYCLGVLGVGAVDTPKPTEGVSTPPPKVGDVYYTNSTDKIQKWSGCENFMDFSPDKVVGIEKYRDRLLIFCEHSIWEIEENCYGDGLQRKQLSFYGMRDRRLNISL